MEITHKTLVNAAKELKEAGILEIKNPNFVKAAELKERLIALEVDFNEVSEETKAVLESLRAPEAEEAVAVPAAEEVADIDATPGEQAEEEEPVYQDEPIPAKEEPEQPAEDLKSREALNTAALDMNEVMGLEPGIDVSLDDELFMKAFTKATSMATGTDNFTDHTWAVLEANELGPERILPKEVKKADLNNKEATGEKKQAAKKSGGAKKEKKGEGVCALITKYLVEHDGKVVSRDEILAYLVEHLPERSADSMKNSVKVAVPSKWSKERGFTFEKVEGGYKVTAPK